MEWGLCLLCNSRFPDSFQNRYHRMFFSKKKKFKRANRPFDTVRCFSAACDAAEMHREEAPLVVHGVMAPAGSFIVYAWCEVDDYVYDYTLNRNPIPREFYYQGNNVVDTGVKRYTYEEYRKMLLVNSGFGPFERTFFQNVIQDMENQE